MAAQMRKRNEQKEKHQPKQPTEKILDFDRRSFFENLSWN